LGLGGGEKLSVTFKRLLGALKEGCLGVKGKVSLMFFGGGEGALTGRQKGTWGKGGAGCGRRPEGASVATGDR